MIVIFIVWIVFILLEQKINFISHEKVCKNNDFCGIVLLFQKDQALQFNQYVKSNKVPYIIYADFDLKIGCVNNPEKS